MFLCILWKRKTTCVHFKKSKNLKPIGRQYFTANKKFGRDETIKNKTAQDFQKKQKKNVIKFSAGGLRDFSRIAASNEIMWRDIFFNNKNNIISGINMFIKNLKSFKKNIQNFEDKNIRKKLIDSKKVRKQIIDLKQDISKPDFGRE